MKTLTKWDMSGNTLLIVAILFGVSTWQTVNPQGADHGKVELYSDVQYLATPPRACPSWMLATTSIDARQFYRNRKDCTSTTFLIGVSRSDLYSYVGTISISRIISTSDCCIEVEVNHHSGWVVRDVLDVAPEQRALYDAHVTEERGDAAAEAARRKRAGAIRAEQDSRYAKYKADEDAKASEERRKIRAACTVIYQDTIDKKVKDLTVREEQQVRACQALGLYPPK